MAGEHANRSPLNVTEFGIDYAAQGASLADKIYFDVPFGQRELAKAAGLRWDGAVRKWYAASAEIAEAFALPVETIAQAPVEPDRHYFNVPFLRKEHAKAMGMRFDGVRKLWFAPNSAIAVDAARTFERIID